MQRSDMKKIFIFLLVCILLTGVRIAWGSDEREKVTVLVAPFGIQSEEPIGYLAQALPRMLISRLEAEENLTTVDETVVAATIRRLNISTLDEDTARRLGIETDANWVVIGKLTKSGNTITLNTSLIDSTGEKPVFSQSYEESSLKNLMDQMSNLARQLSFKIFNKVMVTEVTVQGNRLIEDAAILEQIKTKKNEVFSPEILKEDIRQIYNMGFFSDIKVDSTDEPLGKKVTFIVKENPEIVQIKIAGNKDVDATDIEKQIDIKPHTILNLNKVKSNVVKIKKFYEGKGYHNAVVDFRTEELTPEQSVLVFQIVEYHTMKIKK
ncbi:MAG: hypothetical protein N3A64_00930, partial [Desulfobacterota bacterium]|nr:hypothetical protein [Thermodesulfobacteriota bacterium]